MQTVFEYMIKISAGYAVVYIFYWLVLKRLTNYNSNRFFLLMAGLFVFIMPFLRLDLFITPQTINTSGLISRIPSLNINELTDVYSSEQNANYVAVILATIFVSGIVVCLLYFLVQLISFKKIIKQASLIQATKSIRLYHLDMDIMPFSFGKAIYFNRYKHAQTELEEIVKHETVHAQQYHTIDVIIAGFICMLNWYNPFVWLIKNAMRQNLEFIADDAVLKNGSDKKSYQYLLLKVTGYSPVNIASSFKLSSLKQRIYMMNKARTSQKHLLKLLFVLPLIAFMMLAFRNDNPHVPNTISRSNEESFLLGELTYNIQDANVDKLVKNAQDKSLLHTGKEFTLTTIMNERDRLRILLEKNGYNNISSHAIRFMLDSTFNNKRCSIEINIDLKRKESAFKHSNKQVQNIISGNYFLSNTHDNYRLVTTNRQLENNI